MAGKSKSAGKTRSGALRAADPRGDLEPARLSYARRAWVDAREALLAADRIAPLDLHDLELLAWSSALTDHDEDMAAVGERLYQGWCEAGEPMRAARWAFWIGFRFLGLGETGRASGWMSRAQRLIDREASDCVVSGYLLIPLIRRHLAAGDHDAAYATASSAAEMGERFAEADLLSYARQMQGQIMLRRGRIEAGLALLDEAMLTATAGELSPVMTGLVYCGAIAGCQRVYALDRAREWTTALATWCSAQPQIAPFNAPCAVYRAQILELGGAWPEAIEEAHRAASAKFPQVGADALYQQGEIHRLRGEASLAEEAYKQASQRGRDPQPGLALLRMAEGRFDVASSAIQRVVAAAVDPLERTRLLPALVEISLAAGDRAGARGACEELEATAANLDIEVLRAMAAHARGAVQLAAGDAQGATTPLRHAFRVWHDLGAPYIAARIRVAMARACRALGDEEGAGLELDAAREVFERLGAAPDVALVDTLRRHAPAGHPGGDHPLTPRELEVLRSVAAGKTNRVIARELFVSEKTVDRHVSNIFAKLNVASRAAATAYAYEHDLVVRSPSRG